MLAAGFRWSSLGGSWSLVSGVLADASWSQDWSGPFIMTYKTLNIYIFPSSIILVLTLGSRWLIPMGLGTADCSWRCLIGLVLVARA